MGCVSVCGAAVSAEPCRRGHLHHKLAKLIHDREMKNAGRFEAAGAFFWFLNSTLLGCWRDRGHTACLDRRLGRAGQAQRHLLGCDLPQVALALAIQIHVSIQLHDLLGPRNSQLVARAVEAGTVQANLPLGHHALLAVQFETLARNSE